MSAQTHPLVAQIRANHAAICERLDSSGLSRDQLNFLALHVKRFVIEWRWIFCGAMLRASSERRSVAIRFDELNDLIERDLMRYGLGSANVYATADGKALIP